MSLAWPLIDGLPVSFSSLLPLGGSDIVYMTGTRDNDLAQVTQTAAAFDGDGQR